MANTIMTWKKPPSPRRYIYGVSLSLLIVWFLAYGATYLINVWLDERIDTRQSELQQVEAKITEIGSEQAFFSYKFSEKLASHQGIKWSDQINALIKVLKTIQSDSVVGKNAIQLSDFSISPTKLTLKWKVSNLILLYYSSPTNNYVDLIDRFAQLPFITNISIKQYNKVGNAYEFTLDADIDPNVIIQQEQPESTNSSESSSGSVLTKSGAINTTTGTTIQ